MINCDNTSAINISKTHVMHFKKNKIPIKYHFLRDQVSHKVVKLEYVDIREQIDYISTKPLPKEAFDHLRQKLGVISLK